MADYSPEPAGETAESAELQLQRLAAEAIEGGLLDADRMEIERLLGRQLQQDLLRQSTLVATYPWAAGDYGPADLARRFLEFEAGALRRQLCQPDGKGLRPQYVRLLRPDAPKAGALAGISGTIMATLHTDPQSVVGPAAALYLALLLIHINLEHWCASTGLADQSPADD